MLTPTISPTSSDCTLRHAEADGEPSTQYARAGVATGEDVRADALASAGLVTSAISVRVNNGAGRKPFSFPDRDECAASAASFGGFQWDGREGAVPQIHISPGLVRLTACDLNRRERTRERAMLSDRRMAEIEAARERAGHAVARASRGRITEFSRKSRARMVASMAEIDLAPLLMSMSDPAMITLTYPGDWETVAPHGSAVKGHLKAFFKRFERAWGTKWRGIWKMEFQGRGAAHFHLLMTVPSGCAGEARRGEYARRCAEYAAGRSAVRPRWDGAVGDGLSFREWLSVVWADVVDHPDPVQRERHVRAGTAVDFDEGDRARDPKRAAVYFGKHGSFADKEYQHNVPELWRKSGESVGRFWGYRGLEKIRAGATLDFDTMIFLGRVLRKYGTRTRFWDAENRCHEFRPVVRTELRPRGKRRGFAVSPDGTVTEVRRLRRQTVRVRRMTGKFGAGFLLVNSGADLGKILSRAIDACCRDDSARPPVGMRGSLRERFTFVERGLRLV